LAQAGEGLMATLVFTAVGTAIGGPIGGALGSLLGQQIDNALFAPKARQGPRLGDLTVQTSSYGTAIPKIFGTLRAAGTVIWATGLKETRSTSGGGKGKPKVTSYSYSASFAVALSGRPIKDVRRIWADGKLLRGAAGDFKTRTKFRLYRGSEGQAPDPLIASREGIGATPAHRGLSYAVFEDFQLADYGNRIPSLTFEIVADDAMIEVGALTEMLSGGLVEAGATPALGGYAASGDSISGAIEPLLALMPLSITEADGALRVAMTSGTPVSVPAGDMGAAAGGAPGRTEISRRASGLTPGTVSIAYHDPARDYQTGLQRATRNLPGAKAESRALPASLSASAAKGLADYRLRSLWSARETAKLRISWRRCTLRPGQVLALEGEGGLWKVERWTLDRMVVSLDLVRVPGGRPQDIAASPGRSAEEDDLPPGETRLIVADLPLGEEEARTKPLLLAAAAGTSTGWRQAELIASFSEGATWEAAGTIAAASAMGHLVAAPSPAGAALIDTVNRIDVELLNQSMWLESCSDDAFAAGANLALIGSELIQFGLAEPIGERRFRLSRLLRGRRGTEWAALHQEGETFVLIDRAALLALEPPAGMLGGTVRLVAQGIGDAEGVEAGCAVTGEAIRPPAPVHVRAERRPDGALLLSWTRRSRTGWFWLDGSDAPLGEEREMYELRLSGPGFDRRIVLLEPRHLYNAADHAMDGHPAALNVEIVQIGTLARSRAASFTYNF
jgi:hypothetical protein